MNHRTIALLAGAGLGLAALQAVAAESYDNCTGYLDTVPASITTQGTWCLRQDVGSAVASGNAISINTNNVTIDCNGFRLDGLAVGAGSQALGIRSQGRLNITIRNCAIRGFRAGISLASAAGVPGGGHLIEDNRLDRNLYMGIYASGDNNRVQRNRVYDTGGNDVEAYGIYAYGHVLDNTVAGVSSSSSNSNPYGIRLLGGVGSARGNQVRGLVPKGTGQARGIAVNEVISGSIQHSVTGNHVANIPAVPGWGIDGAGASATFCRGNTVTGFSTAAMIDCHNNGNLSH